MGARCESSMRLDIVTEGCAHDITIAQSQDCRRCVGICVVGAGTLLCRRGGGASSLLPRAGCPQGLQA